MKRLRNIGRLFTGTPIGVIEGAAVILDGEEIAWCGEQRGEPRELADSVTDEHDCEGGLVTAGLIDAHTHPVYAGNRMAEVAMRRRLQSWLAGGATTVEAKTGYHLQRDGELEDTRLLARLSARKDLPRIEVTFLAAHAVPPDRWARMAAYSMQVADWCDDAHAAGARFCDVFCDRGYFSVPQSRSILSAAIRARLIPRIHADELNRTGGSRLAAELHAVSADHLLRANRGDAVALARAGVVATLAPSTALSIGKLPPVKELTEAGAVIALGTDHNPGTSGLTSMSVVVALAVAVFKMSVERALLAATAGGAFSLSRSDRGVVAPHKLADLVLWEAQHEGAFAWAYGLKPRTVWLRGTQVFAG
ncbi:MAG: imidazolonepropionase [Chloroflexi bacterium]|nr:MAG: imidazolonepropionase [Chloroflexota bacterium]